MIRYQGLPPRLTRGVSAVVGNYIMKRQTSLSKTELDAAIEYSYDYINSIFQKQGRVISFDLCYGDGSIHKPLTKEQTKAVYDQMVLELQNK